jgi:hypothetical protein
MPNVRYSPESVSLLKQHYHQYSNAELAQALGIDSEAKVRELARRHGVKWQAENGAPRWRERSQAVPAAHLVVLGEFRRVARRTPTSCCMRSATYCCRQ